MSLLNSVTVVFFDKNDQLCAEETFINEFFTADYSIIKENAEKWAESVKESYGAEYYSIN